MDLNTKTQVFQSSIEAYHSCRYRDLCLRYMGEDPSRWADATSTPCPCSVRFFREIEAYARIIDEENRMGALPYTHRQIINFMVSDRPKVKKTPKARHIPLTQKRLL